MNLLFHMLLPLHSLCNISERLQAYFTQVTYFVERFSDHLPYTDPKTQEVTVCEIQTMQNSTIPAHMEWCQNTKLDGDVVEYHRMDILGAYLGSVKDMVTSQLKFSLVANVAKFPVLMPMRNKYFLSSDRTRLISEVHYR